MGARIRLVVYGLLVWAIPFAIAFAAFPLRDSWRSLFESIIAVTLAATVTVLALDYLRRKSEGHIASGLTAGLVWMAICIVIDLPLMLPAPIAMPFSEYLADIGLTYVMIPIVTTGIGFAMARGG